MPRQIAVLILGMHRSGTSAWAGTLSALGLQLPRRLLDANEFNRKGYFEPESIVRAHDGFLAELGRTWSSVHPLNDETLLNRRSAALAQQLADLIGEEFHAGEPWIIKDPRICVLMPVWHEVLKLLELEPRIVLPVRPPLDVAHSLARRDSMSIDHGYFLWLRHVLDAERHTRGLRRVFVSTDAITTNWRQSLSAVDAALHLGVSDRLDAHTKEIDAFLDPEMFHRETSTDQADDESAGDIRHWADTALDIFGQLATEPQSNRLFDQLDAIRTEFDNRARSVGAVLGDVERALQARIRLYFDERQKRLIAEAQLAAVNTEVERLRQTSRAEGAPAQLESPGVPEETKADLLAAKKAANKARREAEEQLQVERLANLDLSQQLEAAISESERVHADSVRIVAEYEKLKSLYSAEALVRGRLEHEISADAVVRARLQHDLAALRDRQAAEAEAGERLRFDLAQLSARVAAETAARERLHSAHLALEDRYAAEIAARTKAQDEARALRVSSEAQSLELAAKAREAQRLAGVAREARQVAEDVARDAALLARRPFRATAERLAYLSGKAALEWGVVRSARRRDQLLQTIKRRDPDRFRALVTPLGKTLDATPRLTVAPQPEGDAPFQHRSLQVAPGANELELANVWPGATPRRLVYVSHDAHPHGAQMLSLAIIKTLKTDLGFEVEVVLLNEGPLRERFEELAPVHVLSGLDAAGTEAFDLAHQLVAKGFQGAIANTIVSGQFAKVLKSAGFRVVSLVHELAGVIRSGRFESHAQAIAENADRVVFAAPMVRRSFEQFASLDPEKTVIRPQGLYKEPASSDPVHVRTLRNRLRQRLGLSPNAKVVINVGFGDERKGVDLFCDVAKQVISRRNDVAFAWIGGLHVNLEAGLKKVVSSPGLKGKIAFMGLIEPSEVGSVYAGADLFALTSREDPFPSVVLEALDAGLPVVGFEGVTGTNDLIRDGPGDVVEAFDTAAMAEAILRLLDKPEGRPEIRARARAALADEFDFRRYVFDIAALADQRFHCVSVVVPNRNHRPRLEARLRTIVDQTYPIYEIIVLDDASIDGSKAWLEIHLASIAPIARLFANEVESGSSSSQWRKGVQLARGDCVWIAGLDDLAQPDFLESLVKGLEKAGVVMSYCQSRKVNEDGSISAIDGADDFAEISETKWKSPYVEDGAIEISTALAVKNTIPNAGAVVMARAPLQAAIESLGGSWDEFRTTGAWLLWVEVLKSGRVAYDPIALNDHLQTGTTESSGFEEEAVLQEILSVQASVQTHALISPETRQLAFDFAWRMYQRCRPAAEKGASVEPQVSMVTTEPRSDEVTALPGPINIPLLYAGRPPDIEAGLRTALTLFARRQARYYKVSPRVHDKDFIFRFLVNNPSFPTKKDAVEYYFNDGRRSAQELRYILSKPGTNHLLEKERLSLLEFASGYGCVSRHLPHVFPGCDLVSCDIHQDAVEFIQRGLDLPAIVSTLVPEDLQLERTFDVVFALSFFSHMPDHTWGRWLAALFALVAPGGALAFTTHGQTSGAHFGFPTPLNEDGYWFTPDSEQDDLAGEDYGQMVVTPGYVLRQIYEHAPAPLSYFQPGLWWGHQDVYVLMKPKQVS